MGLFLGIGQTEYFGIRDPSKIVANKKPICLPDLQKSRNGFLYEKENSAKSLI